MESHKEDNDDDSKETDWGLIFSILKNRGFSHKEILQLSYPQLNAYMNYLGNENTYNIVVPYLGTGKEDEKNKKIKLKNAPEINDKQELLNLVASMNKDFK